MKVGSNKRILTRGRLHENCTPVSQGDDVEFAGRERDRKDTPPQFARFASLEAPGIAPRGSAPSRSRSRKCTPTKCRFLWLVDDPRSLPNPNPLSQVWMACRPTQHGEGDAEIIMLAGRTCIDGPALPQFGFKVHKLLKSATAHRSFNNSHLIVLHFGVKKFDQ